MVMAIKNMFLNNNHSQIMDGVQYNYYHVFTEKLKVNIGGRTLPLENGCIDQFEKYFLIEARDGANVEIMQIDYNGGVESSYSIEGPATPFVRLSYSQILLFAPQVKTLEFIDFNTQDLREILLATPSSQKDSQYSLHFFTKTQIICLAQKIKEKANAKLTFFSFSAGEATISQTVVYETEANTWKGGKIYEVTPFGKLGWCPDFRSTMEVRIFQAPDKLSTFKIDLTSLGKFPTNEDFQVLAMWQTDNYLYLVVNPLETPSFDKGYSPIIKVNLTTTNLEPAFVPLACPQLLLKKCLNLQDYLVLFSAFNQGGQAPYYIYDKQLQTIVKEQKASLQFSAIKAYQANTYFLASNKEQITISINSIKRVNSLSFQRILQITEKAYASSKQIQTGIVILGADKTGKSTLRNHFAGKKLIHRYNEKYGYNEVVPQDNEEKGLQHEEQRQFLPWMSMTDKVAIVDVPDWNNRGHYFRIQIRILLARLFRIFKHLHFIITIPEEIISSSYENYTFFSSVLEIVGEEGLHEYISIVLTKSETAEDSLALFNDHIEEIIEINQKSGNMLKGISEAQRIIVFENKQLSEDDGRQMLEKVLSFGKLSVKQAIALNIEKEVSEKSADIDRIFYESEYYMRIINAFMIVACHKLAASLFPDAQNTLNAHISHDHPKMNPLKRLKTLDHVGPAFIAALAQLKNFFTKEEKSQEGIDKLKDSLMSLANNLVDDLEQESYFGTAINAFVSAIRNFIQLPFARTDAKETIYSSFTKILKEEPEGILGQSLKTIITTVQTLPEVQSAPQIQEFSSYFGKSLPKKKRIVEQEMTFQQQKRDFLRRKATPLQAICTLPANALKLDLICDQLLRYTKKAKLNPQDYKPLCFYLRQASKVCEFHNLYYQAIVLLAVIPDFAGIERLIDEFALHIRRNTTYDVKKLLNDNQRELVEKLMALSRDCLRDSLVKKLIDLWTSSLETSFKPARLREEAQNKAKEYLSSGESIKSYKERLIKQEVRDFYNLADTDFKKLLAEKQSMVKKCIKYEREEASRKHYQDTEALRYVLDDLPIPV